MARITLGVSIANPNAVAIRPASTFNISYYLSAAMAATTALATAIATALGLATTADNNTGTVQTDVNNSLASFDTAVGVIIGQYSGGTLAYNATTHQITGSPPSGGVTLNQSQLSAQTTALNAVGALLAGAKTDAATAKASTAAAKAAVAGLSTTAISSASASARGAPTGADDMVITFDSAGGVNHLSSLNAAFSSAMNFAVNQTLLPP